MAPIFILRIGWNCVILQPQCLSNRQRNGEAPRGTLESWSRTRTTGCASQSVMPTRGLASTPSLDLASCWNSLPQMQKRELAELLTELIRIMSAQQRVTIVAEQTGRTTTQGAAMHGPGGEARGHPERPRHPCQTYLLNKICVAPEITIRRRPQL